MRGSCYDEEWREEDVERKVKRVSKRTRRQGEEVI
jgi:hypothetical protein